MGPVTKPATDRQIHEFAKAVQGLCDAEKIRDCTVGYTYGKRYAKIIKAWGGQTSVWGFVELATGEIFMAEGWKRPAKHARGSIHAPGMDIAKMKWTGPPYLK